MGQDVTHIVKTLHSRQLFLGITFERLILLLYPLFLIPVLYLWHRDLRRRRFSVPVPPGCTKLGLKGASNCADEFDEKYAKGARNNGQWRVKALYVHPIKSCAPIELDSGDVGVEGFAYDRKFAFAELLKSTTVKQDASEEDRKPKWTFRTLRQPGYEKLALVRPEIWVPNSAGPNGGSNLRRIEREGALIINYPNVPVGAFAGLDNLMLRWGLLPKENSFRVPLNPGNDHKYPKEKVNVWADDPVWLNMAEHVPNDFKEWLGVKSPLSIFRADPESFRNVFRCAPRKEEIGFQPVVGFQDAYPLNLMNLASVRDVGNKLGDTIDKLTVRRFRTNIVLEGPPAYDEDDWKSVRIGENEFYCACRTVRCRVSILLQIRDVATDTTSYLMLIPIQVSVTLPNLTRPSNRSAV